MIFNIIFGTILFLIALIDFKFKEIPSMFLTGILFVVLVINSNNLVYGAITFCFAWLIYEGDFIGGLADVKVITMIGLFVSSLNYLFVMIILTLLLGFAWKGALRLYYKKNKEIAFIPVLFIVFIILNIIGGIA